MRPRGWGAAASCTVVSPPNGCRLMYLRTVTHQRENRQRLLLVFVGKEVSRCVTSGGCGIVDSSSERRTERCGMSFQRTRPLSDTDVVDEEADVTLKQREPRAAERSAMLLACSRASAHC